MAAYELSKDAEQDLQFIAHYTVKTWGIEQAQRYAEILERHFGELGGERLRPRVFLKHRPELLVSRCEHHYVFHLVRAANCPLVLAIFHENMDLMNRLRHRLDGV